MIHHLDPDDCFIDLLAAHNRNCRMVREPPRNEFHGTPWGNAFGELESVNSLTRDPRSEGRLLKVGFCQNGPQIRYIRSGVQTDRQIVDPVDGGPTPCLRGNSGKPEIRLPLGECPPGRFASVVTDDRRSVVFDPPLFGTSRCKTIRRSISPSACTDSPAIR